MAYCDAASIASRFPSENLVALTDDHELGAIDQAILDAAIAEADELIDGYLRGVANLPLQVPVPSMVGTISCDLAMSFLYDRRPEPSIPSAVSTRETEARQALANIQAGIIVLAFAGETVNTEYCTYADLGERFPSVDLVQLTDDTGAGAVNMNAINAAIADAGDLIDGYLRGITTLPLTAPFPGVIKRACIDLVMYDLHTRRDGIPPVVQSRYEDARATLDQIQRKKLVLQFAGVPTVAPQASSYLTDKTAADALFTPDLLSRF